MIRTLKNAILRGVEPFIRLPIGGMDISDLSVKYLVLRPRGRKLTFDFWGELILPEGLITGGEIKDESGLIKLFDSWLAKEGRQLRSNFFAVSLPEEKSFLRAVQLPKIKKEDVANAIRWEIETNIPLPAEETMFDHEIIELPSINSNHTDVVITAFPRPIIESYLRIFRKVGLGVAFLELESQAIVRAVVDNFTDTSSKIIVDLGRTRTSIILFSYGSIIFTSTIEVGGLTFEENISRALEVSKESASLIKKETGLDKRSRNGQIFSALLPAVSELGSELKRVVDYYQRRGLHVHAENSEIKEIILTGGDANLDGLDTFLGSSLRIPTTRANPFRHIESRLDVTVPPISRNRTLGFTTTVGLALRGIQTS